MSEKKLTGLDFQYFNSKRNASTHWATFQKVTLAKQKIPTLSQ